MSLRLQFSSFDCLSNNIIKAYNIIHCKKRLFTNSDAIGNSEYSFNTWRSMSKTTISSITVFDNDDEAEQKRTSSSTEITAIYSSPEKRTEPDAPEADNSRSTTSTFGDGSCGEPLVSQHLVLDFTPVEQMDDDFVQKKCCAFWDFVRSHPEFHEWLTLPKDDENVTVSTESGSNTCDTSRGVQVKPDGAFSSPTAVSMLEFVDERGLIGQTFETILAQSHCSQSTRGLGEDRGSTANRLRSKKGKRGACDEGCICKGACERCQRQSFRDLPPSSTTTEVREMCQQMNEWDANHAKSMESPGHPPDLTDCIRQRNVIS